MIGDGWDGDPSVRPAPDDPALDRTPGVRRIAVVTGTRAEFGLLKPVMRAIQARQDQQLLVIAAGSHLVSPATTYREVKAAFADSIAGAIPMQVAGRNGRDADVEALATGIARFGRLFSRLQPDWVVVLGDRIEALAAAAAASIGGHALAHIHGGDRAEGVADEAMRGAITKLAHLHLAASQQSADRLIRMGERPDTVRLVGSPAIDGLAEIPPISDARDAELASPTVLFLMHPVGRPAEHEESIAAAALDAALSNPTDRILALDPNLDAGRDGIIAAINAAAQRHPDRLRTAAHLPRDQFVGLLKRMAARRSGKGAGGGGGILLGNSSAALIEAAAIPIAAVDIGPRQSGRERAANVISSTESAHQIEAAIASARALNLANLAHPYGDGHSAPRIAAALAEVNPHDPRLLRKRCAY